MSLFEQLAGDEGRGMTLAQVSRHLSVHKASCHAMLSELLRAGWLLRDPVRKTYHLGPALVRLGREAASRYPALVLARCAMAELSAATGAHCIAFSVSDDHSTVVDQVRSPHGGGHPMPIGTQFPTARRMGRRSWPGPDQMLGSGGWLPCPRMCVIGTARRWQRPSSAATRSACISCPTCACGNWRRSCAVPKCVPRG
ncbi:iclR helix-turn-helix domain protein [Mycobacterium xenopi 3993]|nr:iclR helix-turn-helix domain protein [Mycobacterium xenopi 3993]